MSWLAPGMFWFALLIPAVLLLWFLRMKRREVEVPSTLLWAKALEDKRVNSPFQRLRRSILLLLQLLVIALLTAALARPERRGEEVAGRVHIILVDVSASMAVEDAAGGTRLERARALARERVERMGDGERAVLISFDRGARALTPVTGDRALLRREIDRLAASVARTEIGPAMELALGIASRQHDAVAAIISDGAFEAWEGKQIPLPLEFLPVGSAAANAGITALSAREEPGAVGALRIFVEVRNPGPAPAAGTLTLSLGGAPVRVSEQPGIEPGGRWPHTFELSGGGGEVLDVVWEPRGEDLLAADDRAWIVVEPPRTLSVWQIGPPNFALDDALSVLPHVEVEFLAPEAAKERLEGGAATLPDIAIWDRTAPAILPAGPAHLFLGALPPGVWAPVPEMVERPPVIAWDREHPLHRFVDYAGLDGEIAEAWLLPDLPGSRALLDSRGGALIRTFRHEGSEGIVVAFDAMKTRWPLRPTFPFFLGAALAHLGHRAETAEGVRPGDLIAIEGGPDVMSYRVTDPGGRERQIAASEDGWLRFDGTDRLGPYRIEWTEPPARADAAPVERARTVPVSLLSLGESTIAPRERVGIAGGELGAESANRALARQHFWPWLLALGSLLLLAEWFFYHRR